MVDGPDDVFVEREGSVQVPQPSSGYYRIEIETDLGNSTQVIDSDLIPFSEAQAAGFKLYLKTEFEGLDFSTAHIVQVPPW